MDRFLFFIVHSPRKKNLVPIWKGRSKEKALGTRLLEKLAWSKRIMQAFQTLVFLRVKINTQAPCTRIRLFLNPQLFLSGYCFRPHVRWIRHTNPPETCGRANSIWIRIRVKVEIFLIRKEKVAHSKISVYMWTGPFFSRFRRTHRKHEAEYDMKNRYAYRGGCYQQSPLAKQTCRTAGYRDINRG